MVVSDLLRRGDADRSDRLTLGEFEGCVRSVGYEMPSEILHEAFKAIDDLHSHRTKCPFLASPIHEHCEV